MNTIEIGKYIKRKRIEMHLTQKVLAEKLNISFQAVSKWETGITLPDTAILLELSDCLEVTVDQILNAGEFRKRMNRNINVDEVKMAIKSIIKIKETLGANSSIYKGMSAGLNEGEDESFEVALLDPTKREIIIAKSCVELIIDGYNLSDEDIENHFPTEMVRQKLRKVMTKYSQT